VFTNLTGAWALSTFGFISAALLPIPWALFKWGPALRARSKYSRRMMNPEKMSMEMPTAMVEDTSSATPLAGSEV